MQDKEDGKAWRKKLEKMNVGPYTDGELQQPAWVHGAHSESQFDGHVVLHDPSHADSKSRTFSESLSL
jgi:hypothetical protein